MSLDCHYCKKVAAIDRLPSDELVWQFPFSIAFLGPWQSYRGYCILVSRKHATELSQLDDEARLGFLDEMCMVARAVEECFQPRKLNYEMLGNQTPHMHWHVIPRYRNDPDAAHPIWQHIERVKGDKAAQRRLLEGPTVRAGTIAALRKRLETIAPGNP